MHVLRNFEPIPILSIKNHCTDRLSNLYKICVYKIQTHVTVPGAYKNRTITKNIIPFVERTKSHSIKTFIYKRVRHLAPRREFEVYTKKSTLDFNGHPLGDFDTDSNLERLNAQYPKQT